MKFMQSTQSASKNPVVWCGDLNVAHKAYDVHNDGAKHLAKQAGTTPQERRGFDEQLGAGFFDAFRHVHGEDAKGHYSYWSQRAFNRAPNKGLRLDYYICSEDMAVGKGEPSGDKVFVVRDTYMLPEVTGSDHAPVVGIFECDQK